MPTAKHDVVSIHRTSLVPNSSSKVTKPHEASNELLFTIDRRGDHQNITYGSLDKYKISRYRTAGYGRLLGLDRRFRITSVTDTKREIGDESHDGTRQTTRSALSLLSSKMPDASDHVNAQNTPAQPDAAFQNQQSYISLNTSRSTKRRKLSTQQQMHEPNSALIAPDTESESHDTSGTESEDETEKDIVEDAFDAFRNHPDNVKQIQLSRQVDVHPQDGEAWMNLIDHQQEFYFMSTSGNSQLSSAAQNAVIDIRLSMYEKALAKVPKSATRELLLVKYMQEGARVWDTARLLEKWKGVLRDSPTVLLWTQFLNLQQTHATIFSYEQCLETYSTVLQIIRSLNDQQERNPQYCYIILRLTTFMYQAGYAERAIAIWQALLELTFFRPFQLRVEEILESFEQFWDSETARVGEANAAGWNGNNVDVDPKADNLPHALDRNDILLSWASGEQTRSVVDILPARTLDDTLEDDPFRVIIWSDIKDFLALLLTDEAKTLLIQAFLQFSRLPTFDKDIRHCHSWWTDPFLCHYQVVPGSGEDSNTRGGIPSFLPDTQTMFATSHWFGIWQGVSRMNPKLLQFAISALSQLVELGTTDDRLAVYLVALKFSQDPVTARKYAKSLLKKKSDSLVLYSAYAIMEARSGKIDSAMKVWSAALSTTSLLNQEKQKQAVLLWHDLVCELLASSSWTKAREVLIHLMPPGLAQNITTAADTSKSYTTNDYLKAEVFYRSNISDALTEGDRRTITSYTDLFAILNYLSNDHDLQKAIKIYDTTMAALSTDSQIEVSTTIECIHQYRAHLINIHAQAFPTKYRPIQLTSYLQQSLILFPNNAIFYTLHDHYSRGAGLVNRLRDGLNRDIASTHKFDAQYQRHQPKRGVRHDTSLFTHSLLKIDRELSRPAYAGATEHSIRSAFAAAPGSQTTSPTSPLPPNPALHIARIKWEISLLPIFSSSLTNLDGTQGLHLKFRLSTLKQTYLSALQACPWSKDIYLLAFTDDVLRVALSSSTSGTDSRSRNERGSGRGEGNDNTELMEIYKTMLERGIRVRIDIEGEID